MKQANAPKWAQVRDAKAYEGKDPDNANRCRNPLVYAAVEDGVTFADRLGLATMFWTGSCGT